MSIRADQFALTPKLYGPVAQYALRGRGAQLYPDRSGNALHLLDIVNTPLAAPDGYPDVCLNAGRIRAPVQPQLQIVGDLTCTVRACIIANGARHFVFTENDGSSVAGPYGFLVEPDGRLYAGVETSDQQGYGWYAPTLRVKWGRWAFYSIRRDVAAGRWTIGVDGRYETSAPQVVTVPLNGTQPRLFVGGPDVGNTGVTLGGVADLSIWSKRLSDAEVDGLNAAVMPANTEKPAAFMPKLYAPVAQWPLNFATTEAAGLADVSGNARHLAKVSLVGVAADKVPQAVSPKGSAGAGSKLTAGVLGSADTTWAITGPMTVVCRALFDGDVSRTQVLYQSNFYPYGPSPVRCVPFTLATVAPNGALLSYAQHGSNQADAWTSVLAPPALRWCFLSFRRAANGVLTIGVNLSFDDSPALPMPGPTAPGVQLGLMNSNDGIAPLAWGGQLADLAVWDKRLTDEELLPLYRAAMGK